MAWRYHDGPAGSVRVLVDDCNIDHPPSETRWPWRPASWLNRITAILCLLGVVWAIQGIVIPWNPQGDRFFVFKGACFVHHPTAEEIEKQWQIIGRMNNCVILPEIRPTRPSPEETAKFYSTTVKNLWQQGLAKEEQYFLEDYFADLQKQLDLCKANLMPLRYSFDVDAWGSGMDDAQQLAMKNGWRDKKNEEDFDSLAQMKREEQYSNWYSRATAIADPKIDWLAIARWLLTTYLKGIVVCFILYLVRLWADDTLGLRSEIGLAPLRFAKMLVGWPVYVWLYPHETTAATELRRLRLKAEYLRDKPSGYQLSAAEKAYLAELASQPRFQLHQLLALIQAEQDLARRKALATVGLLMLFGLICSALARAQALEERQPTMVCSVSSTETLVHCARDGPTSNPTLLPERVLLAVIEVVEQLMVVTVSHLSLGAFERIDHVPKSLMA
ncbi:MAG: hypothetical protein WC518_04270 [Patescibacteria group bacterium]